MKAKVDQPRALESKAKNSETRLVSKPDSKDDLKSLPLPEVEKRLGSSAKGLSQAEAQKRLAQYGPNEIKEKKDNLFLKFLSYFWGPIPWMIEGAVSLSGLVRHWLDFFIILFLLFSNAVVAFWEEHQAGNEIAALRAKLATEARALRDGKWATPKVAELVPGDVIRLRLGDIVPADARLLAGDPVQVDQSALTGESLPATRKPGEAVFSGSIIKRGETVDDGVCHRYRHLFRQDCGISAGCSYRQPFPACCAQDWQLPDRSRSGSGDGHRHSGTLPS